MRTRSSAFTASLLEKVYYTFKILTAEILFSDNNRGTKQNSLDLVKLNGLETIEKTP